MKRIFLLLLLLFTLSVWATYTIDAARLPYSGTWAAAGVSGGCAQYRSGGANARTVWTYDVVHYGADATGVSDSTSAFAAATAACPAGQVISIPAGTFRLNSAILLSSGQTWRGAGTGLTTLMMYGGFFYTNSTWPNPTPTVTVTGGATKGSTVLTVDDASTVTANLQVTLTQLNPAYVHSNTMPPYGSGPAENGHDATRLMAVTFMVVSKDNTAKTVTLDHPMPIDMTDTPMLTIWTTYCTRSIGFEDMTIDLTNSTAGRAFLMCNADNCWWYNVKFHHMQQRSVWFETATNCTVEHCDSDSAAAPGGGANHEGLDFYLNSCWNLVQNCSFDNAGYPMIILGDWGGGCVGNVIAYNYCRNETGQYFAPMAVSDNHGPHNMFNLWEGNYVQNFSSDGYFGSDSHNTLARNYFNGMYVLADGYSEVCAIGLAHWATTYNVVGNILGTASYSTVYEASGTVSQAPQIYRLGYPTTANRSYSVSASNPTDPTYYDTNTAATLLRVGNYDYVNNARDTTDTIPDSYYLTSKPSWFGSLAWPAFDPAHPELASATSIPAGYRYTYGVDPPSSAAPATAGRRAAQAAMQAGVGF